MRVLITGGHFSPAYSIISELKKRGAEIIIAGRRHPFEDDKTLSLEYLICQKENLTFFEIKTGRFQRKFTLYTISSLLKTPYGFLNALALLRKTKPDVIMTFGGYLGLPISYAAAFLRIPVVLHEQTQAAGLAATNIARVANKICISFKSSASCFPENKTVFTGNPIRDEVLKVEKKITLPKGKVVYVSGGSTGSHFINELIYEIMDELLSEYVVIHQAGESLRFDDFEKLNKKRESLPAEKKNKYILRKFIYPDEIGFVFENADLILSRSGANTVLEIFATQKMSLLIPLPHGQGGEQLSNAKLVSKLGVGECIQQKDASGANILSKINLMFKDSAKYKQNVKETEEYVVPDAASRIVDVIESVNK